MRSTIFSFFIIALSLGCNNKKNYEYVIPINYKGMIQIIYKYPGGAEYQKIGSVYNINVDETGRLYLKNSPDNDYRIIRFRYANGKYIVDHNPLKSNDQQTIYFWAIGTTVYNSTQYNNKYEMDEFYVGTEGDYKTFFKIQ
jgi:hypothetical protein